MKKVMLFLIVTLGFCGSFFAQTSHWPDFDLYEYEQHGSIVAIVQIDNAIVGSDDSWDMLEIGAFVNGTVRGHAFMDYFPEYGDLYPIVQLEIYYDNTGEEVSFKLYNHGNDYEYEVCASTINPVTEEALKTGDDYTDYDNPLVISFFTPFTKTILGYTEGSKDHYYLIASPIGEVNPGDVTNMTSNEYDLYYFDQSVDLEWINIKDGNTPLVSGKGYLYANSEDVTLVFAGIPYTGDGNVTLYKNDDAEWSGWNLVGNPFSVDAYIDRPFYVMNSNGTEIEPAQRSNVEVMEGVFVIANEDGETMTFTTEVSSKANGQIVLNVTRDRGAAIDRAIVRFGESSMLPKFQINRNSTKVYIPMEGKDYAVVAAAEMGEIPVNFKAEENGTYTIVVNVEEMDVNYLHLIDNMTGTDVDLFVNPSYTFNAATTDYASRFKLVFATGNTSDDNFAFFSNGSFVINNEGHATLQVIDVNGRMLSNESINGCANISVDAAAGVYMLRLINGENVKVQKVIIK